MINYYNHGKWIIWISFFVSFLLETIPWPNSISFFHPNWVLLVLFYWILMLPHKVNIGTGFIVGIILDIISGSILGIHSLSISIVAYLLMLKFQLFRSLASWQQSLVITFFSFLEEIIICFIEFLVIKIPFHMEVFLRTIVNGLLWPWLSLVMQKIRHKFSSSEEFFF